MAEQAAARALRFRPKKVTTEMVETVTGMFPDIPNANIHYDLLRTGSVELTTNKILERGFLDAPPEAYFTLYPHQSGADVVPRPAGTPTTARTTVTAQARPKDTLISRYGLEYRLPNADVVPSPQQDAGGRAVWEDTAEKREASLRERKAQMILAARQRMLAAQRIPAKSPTA
jgi:coupling of ubiquitin conjugation to ER degradation protein 1